MEPVRLSIIEAQYVERYTVRILFNDTSTKHVDFGQFILSSQNSLITKFKDLRRFKRFKIQDGNVVWGKDWDLIFPIEQIYNNHIVL